MSLENFAARPENLAQRSKRLLMTALLTMIARLPYRVLLGFGSALGHVFMKLSARRRRITQRNIERCFPERDAAARKALVQANFRATGQGSMEVALAWFGSARKLASLCELHGLEHLQAAQAQGKGVIVLGFHFSTIELGSVLLAQKIPLQGMYRPNNDPGIDNLINRGRLRSFEQMISRFNARGMLKALKQGANVLYLPDQDLGARDSEFVPFFGIQTAWVTAITRFAQMSGAPVVPFFHCRKSDGRGLELHLLPALEQFPSGTAPDQIRADLQRISTLLEQELRRHPENYLWVHRRFKTRPPGEAPFYGR